jgi:hypothetical protein
MPYTITSSRSARSRTFWGVTSFCPISGPVSLPSLRTRITRLPEVAGCTALIASSIARHRGVGAVAGIDFGSSEISCSGSRVKAGLKAIFCPNMPSFATSLDPRWLRRSRQARADNRKVVCHAAAQIEQRNQADRLWNAVEHRNRLRRAVVENLKVLACQTADQSALAVRDGHEDGTMSDELRKLWARGTSRTGATWRRQAFRCEDARHLHCGRN